MHPYLEAITPPLQHAFSRDRGPVEFDVATFIQGLPSMVAHHVVSETPLGELDRQARSWHEAALQRGRITENYPRPRVVHLGGLGARETLETVWCGGVTFGRCCTSVYVVDNERSSAARIAIVPKQSRESDSFVKTSLVPKAQVHTIARATLASYIYGKSQATDH